MRIEEISIHSGKAIIASRPEVQASVFAVVVNAQQRFERRKTKFFDWDRVVREEFSREVWKNSSELGFDLLKERVAIEIEFSRYEFIYRDYFRFLSAYNANKIDVGVLIINADPKSGRVKHPAVAPSLARIKDDLAWLRPTLTVPLWVVALK